MVAKMGKSSQIWCLCWIFVHSRAQTGSTDMNFLAKKTIFTTVEGRSTVLTTRRGLIRSKSALEDKILG